jgi:TonB family protein
LTRDASEGLVTIPDTSRDLSELDGRLETRIEEHKKQIPWTRYYRAAAVLIVLVLLSYVVYQFIESDFFRKGEVAMVAKEEKSDSVYLQPSVEPARGDSAWVHQPSGPYVNLPLAAVTPESEYEVSQSDSAQARITTGITLSYEETAAVGETAVADAGMGEADVIPDEEQPVEEEITELISMDDSDKEKKSEAIQSISGAAGREGGEVAARSMPAVSGAAGPAPVNGFPAFETYLKNNLRYPETARSSQVEGVVTVEFFVNTDSTLQQLTIIKGLGSGCDEEALRLIREGPKWRPEIRNGTPARSKTTVTVNFAIEE